MSRNREIRDLTRDLKANCEFIAGDLRFRELVTEKELADYLPGGEENSRSGSELGAWIFCYANYVRFCGRQFAAEERRAAAASIGEEEVIRALADSTESVTLSSGEKVTLYPKSFEALRVIEKLDGRIHWLTEKRAQLAERNEYDDVQLLERTVVEISFLYSLIVWAATHEGVGLPFAEDDDAPKIPDRILAYSPTDLLAVRTGFLRVNALRLHVLLTMLSEKKQPHPAARQSWATFFALREEDSKIPARTLMRDRSLASQLASSLLAGDAHEAAREKAKLEQQVA